jgi:hypothetical protein
MGWEHVFTGSVAKWGSLPRLRKPTLFDIAGSGQERALLAVALLIEPAVRKRSLLRYLKSTKSVSRPPELPPGLADILVEC